MSAPTYYVMQLIEGDECLLHHSPEVMAALEYARAEKRRNPHAELSIWSDKGGIVIPDVIA